MLGDPRVDARSDNVSPGDGGQQQRGPASGQCPEHFLEREVATEYPHVRCYCEHGGLPANIGNLAVMRWMVWLRADAEEYHHDVSVFLLSQPASAGRP